MSFRSLARSLALAAGLALPAQALQLGRFKPLFDYTNLPPTNEEFWGALSGGSVSMEDAIALAEETEKTVVRVLRAEQRLGPAPTWQLELFVGDGPEPKRVNFTIASAKKEVVKRLELRSASPEDAALLPLLLASQVPGEDAIEVAKKALIGSKPVPMVSDPRARTLEFSGEHGVSQWKFEMMALDKKEQRPRRYAVVCDTKAPQFKHTLLLDRFPGTPLRRGRPTQLENGLVIYDFQEGEGEPATPDSHAKFDYRLWLLDNTKIHDTQKTKLPEVFTVSEAPLEGMRLGILGMKPGGRRKICMPYSLAFGEAGNEIAPPKAMIVCDIYLRDYVGGKGEPKTAEPK
jgi:FKBP-type peptidyl-prolyl cis-trans isomerase